MSGRWTVVVLVACLVVGHAGGAPATTSATSTAGRSATAPANGLGTAPAIGTATAPANGLGTAPAIGTATAPASAQDGTVVGRPSLGIVLLGNRVTPGTDVTLSLLLVNDARVFRGGSLRAEERVTTAYNVSIRPATEEFGERLAEELSFEARRIPVGVVAPGVTDPLPLGLSVGQLPPGSYQIPFEVNYSYTTVVQPNQTVRLRTRTETVTATLVVETAPLLRVATASDQTLTPGQSQVVRFEVTNVGTGTAREVGLTLSADNGSVYFGTRLDRQSGVGFYLPSLEPGETETVAVRMGADDATEPGTYLVAGRATYRDEAGDVHEAEWLPAGIAVGNSSDSQSVASPAPSRTITAIPVSKSAIASAESSARPTPSTSPSS